MPSTGARTPGETLPGGIISFDGEMAQRILLGFDALDKYSQDLLAKHAKKRSLSYLQRIPSLRISLSSDFDWETNRDPESTNNSRPSSPRSSSYPVNTDIGKTVRLRPFTASGHCISPDYESKERELKKLTKPRCVSANRRRSWRSEVESIPDLDSLCLAENSGPVLSNLGAPFILSPRGTAEDSCTTENSEAPERVDDMRPKGTSLLPDTSGEVIIKSLSHPPRENMQKAAAVSLCIEDEMKKSDVKILTTRQKTISGHVQKVSETHPIIYNDHINTLSNFQKSLVTRPYYFTSSQRPMNKPSSPMGPLLHNKTDSATDFLRSRQLRLQDAALKKSKATNVLSSDNIILHYLSADGAKQRVDMAKGGHAGKKKEENRSVDRRNIVQEGKIIHISPANENKDEELSVGPVINGINPLVAMDHVPSPYGRSHHTSRLFCPNSARTSRSPIPRPNSIREIHNVSFISILKPLSPAEGPLEPLQKKKLSATASPDLERDIMTPMPGAKLLRFTTKSAILETRIRKRGPSPVEVNPIGTNLAPERSTEGLQEENKMEGGGGVESTSEISQTPAPPATELLGNTKSWNDSSEEQTRNNFSSPVHISTTPVITIPTATME